ncbi:hypothetical protein N9R09_00615 [Porticoccaceae bacterium]|nr:hypothetical protein [Porticoccaceae bacterium]
MSHSKLDSTNHELSNKKTSAGVRFADVPEDARHEVEWIDGCHTFNGQLPSLDELPVPEVLTQLPSLNPDRPTGSKAMLCIHGARGRLVGLRAGTSLAMAPAYVVAQLCDFVDLDGPIFLIEDRPSPLSYRHGIVDGFSSQLWG